MKRFDLPGVIVNGILAACMGLAVAGCLISAFALEASIAEVLLVCLFWAALTCAVLRLKHGWYAIPICLVLWWLLLWEADTSHQFGSMMRTMFTIYSRAYGIQVPHGLLIYDDPSTTQAISVIGGIVTIIAGISLTQFRSASLAVTSAVLPITLCFFVTDTVPHEFYLFLLFSSMAVAILSQNLRRRNPRQASRLAAILMLPVLLCNILLFQANPQQEYDKHPPNSMEELLTQLLAPLIEPIKPTLPKLPSLPSLPSLPDLPVLTPGQVNLQYVGPKNSRNDLVMKVQTDLTGTIYLRGKSYGDYNGLTWSASTVQNDSLEIDDAYLRSFLNHGIHSIISVSTVSPNSIFYTAYYPKTYTSFEEGAYQNHNKHTEYTIPVDPLRSDWQAQYLRYDPNFTLQDFEWAGYPPGGFTNLPEETRLRAELYLEENNISPNSPILYAINTIASLVRDSARYDLNTPRMPSGETDFALWFLEDSDTGYCIHFASAATVLLRAAGIPARYVVGYMTTVNSDGTANVTEAQSHAWVEYWLPNVGWMMLEVTPSAGQQPPVGTTNPTEPTTRPTEPTTKPTEPTTRPAEPTTRPTEPTTQPAEPTTRPTQPSTHPTEPTTRPTEPTTKPTWPSQTMEPSTVPPVTTPATWDPGEPKADLTWLWATLQCLLVTLLAAATVIGQWQLRLWLRKKWLCNGSANIQALRRWRFVKYLARLRRQDAPAALKDLALKARFSQHTISDEELAAFDGYFARSVAHLKSRSLPMRLLYRLIFAAY